MNMNVYIVNGEHPEVPSVRRKVALTMGEANVIAAEMVAIIALDVEQMEDEDRAGEPWDVTADNWQDRLLWAQARCVMRSRSPSLPASYEEARALLEPMSLTERCEEADCGVWIETHEVEAPATVRVWHGFIDTDKLGTELCVATSERAMEDWVLERAGSSRAKYEEWRGETAPDAPAFVGDYLQSHHDVVGNLDTWSWEYDDIPVPGIGQPARIVLGVDGGIVQGASSDVPVEIFVADYDNDGTEIPQSDGTTSEGSLGDLGVDVDPAWVNTIRALVLETEA